MNFFKTGLRIWIATGSVIGFFGGWALLAHSPKPAQPAQQPVVVQMAPLPTLAPLPPIGDLNNQPGFQQPQPLPQLQPSMPQTGFFGGFRTGGS